MATSTKERLIRTAHELFYVQGFHSVGLDQIIGEVGVTKTTFYNHFPSKDDLVLEVLRWHDRWWREEFVALLRRHGGDSPRGQLLAVGKGLDELFSTGQYNGCIFINVAVQFPLPHDPAHVVAAEHKRAMADVIRQLAGYAGAADPEALADELSMALEGAYVTRQVTGDDRTGQILGRLAELIVRRHIGE
jgi:AcrR family transcriptional regulator